MINKKTDMYMDSKGIFHNPTLNEYNKYIKDSVWYNKEIIQKIRTETKRKIERLQKEIKEIKKIGAENIHKEKSTIEHKKEPINQFEYSKKCKETEKSLIEFRAKMQEIKNKSEV